MSQNVQTPEPIRVAHVITGLQTGGAEAMLNKLVQVSVVRSMPLSLLLRPAVSIKKS